MPFSQFIDRVTYIPVVRAALVLAVHNCAQDREDSCGVPLQRQVPVLQRRAHSVNCAEDRRDPSGACAVLGGV